MIRHVFLGNDPIAILGVPLFGAHKMALHDAVYPVFSNGHDFLLVNQFFQTLLAVILLGSRVDSFILLGFNSDALPWRGFPVSQGRQFLLGQDLLSFEDCGLRDEPCQILIVSDVMAPMIGGRGCRYGHMLEVNHLLPLPLAWLLQAVIVHSLRLQRVMRDLLKGNRVTSLDAALVHGPV